MAALGYTKGNIQKILLYENMGLSALSVISSGSLIVLTLVIGKSIGFPFVFSAWQIVGTLLLTAVFMLAISLFSSMKLVNTEPAEALRR